VRRLGERFGERRRRGDCRGERFGERRFGDRDERRLGDRCRDVRGLSRERAISVSCIPPKKKLSH
tara:strand:+ start:2353 stop:2547 length:195 start_codon:yes stop_codon:yes gene_type:complete